MNRTTKFNLSLILLCAAGLCGGCQTAQAQCPNGNCSSAGFYSPWVGGWYWNYPYYQYQAQKPEAKKPEVKEEQQPEPEIKEEQQIEPAPQIEFKPLCQKVAELVNAQRAAVGLPPLVLNQSLCEGCDRHSAFMANGGGFQHSYYAGARECIAMGVSTPEAVVRLWLTSDAHRAIILGGGGSIGVGFSGVYWTLRVR